MNSRQRMSLACKITTAVAIVSLTSGARAQSQGADQMEEVGVADLARELQNPITSLINIPLQNDIDFGISESDGFRDTLTAQPVVAIPLTDQWRLVSRTLAPVILQHDVQGQSGEQFGLGDITESLFLSPARMPGGLIFGVGPAFLIPIATEDMLGTGKWCVGPTGAAVQQLGPWTLGVLANHLWSFAGEDDRSQISTTYVQPFVAYTFPMGMTVNVNSETSMDWIKDRITIPFNAVVSQVVLIAGQPMSFGLGGRWYLDSPPGGEDWGLRAVATMLFP